MRFSFFIPWITQGRGGTEHVGSVMANAMVARGHDVVVHTFDDEDGAPQWPLADEIVLKRHPETLTVAVEDALVETLASEKPGLIVGLHMNRTLFHYTSLANRVGCPVLISEHADPQETAANDVNSPEERLVALGAATRVHLLSEIFAEDLPKEIRSRVTILPNSAQPARVLADPVGAETSPKTLLYVGRLTGPKNLLLLIHAFAMTEPDQPWRLVIAGYGHQEKRLRDLVAEKGLEDRVVFAGQVEDVYSCYEQAQILVQPSRAEAFGLTVLEAMAHGLPTIGLKQTRGLGTLISDEETGLLVDGTVRKLAAGMSRLMNDPDLRQQMGAAGLELYKAEFDWSSYGDKVERMLLETIQTARLAGLKPALLAPLRSVVARRLKMNLQDAFDTRLDADDFRRLRLAFFIPWITTGRGGTENVGSMMANAMAEAGHHVVVHTFDNEDGDSQWPLAEEISLRCHPERLTVADECRLVAELAAEQPDLIIGLHMNRTMLQYTTIAERIGCPVLLSEHADPAQTARVKRLLPPERLVAFAGATRVHLLANVFGKKLPNVLRDRVTVLPNAVLPARKAGDPLGSDKAPKTLLFVGRLAPRKNAALLIEAFAKVKTAEDWTLRIVGYGEEEENLKNLVASRKLASRVQFVGKISDTYAEYERAQILCLPSEWEACPLTPIEAMAHGLPTVGLRQCTGLDEVIAHDETGILSGETSDDLARALEQLMNDSGLRERMGAEGLRRYSEKFDWNSYPGKIEAMILETLETAQRDGRRAALDGPLNDALNKRLQMGLQETFDKRLRKI